MEKNVLKVITDAMLEKKGQQVVSLDLSSIGTAISDYFVVCNADSTTAVAAIADRCFANTFGLSMSHTAQLSIYGRKRSVSAIAEA